MLKKNLPRHYLLSTHDFLGHAFDCCKSQTQGPRSLVKSITSVTLSNAINTIKFGSQEMPCMEGIGSFTLYVMVVFQWDRFQNG